MMNKADIDRFNEALDAVKELSLKITAATVAGQSALRGLDATTEELALDSLSMSTAAAIKAMIGMEAYLEDISDLMYELRGDKKDE